MIIKLCIKWSGKLVNRVQLKVVTTNYENDQIKEKKVKNTKNELDGDDYDEGTVQRIYKTTSRFFWKIKTNQSLVKFQKENVRRHRWMILGIIKGMHREIK